MTWYSCFRLRRHMSAVILWSNLSCILVTSNLLSLYRSLQIKGAQQNCICLFIQRIETDPISLCVGRNHPIHLQTDQHHSLITSECFTDWKITRRRTIYFPVLFQIGQSLRLVLLIEQRAAITVQGLIASYELQRISINQSKMNKRGNLKVYQPIKQARRALQSIKPPSLKEEQDIL